MEYSIAQVAEKTRMTAYTLRYYDKEGLLPSIARSKAGNRVFTDADLDTLAMIGCLKRTGMPIKQIRQITDWEKSGDGTLHDRKDALLRHKDAVLEKICELQKSLRYIDRKLDYFNDACEAYDTGAPIPLCCDYRLEE